jgi:hypothetical protein
MMAEMRTGKRPTDVFKAIVHGDPSITNSDLALMFKQEFLNVRAEAMQSIWNWCRPGRSHGILDDRMDAIVTFYLMEAGFVYEDIDAKLALYSKQAGYPVPSM